MSRALISGLELISSLDGFGNEYGWQFHAFCDEHDDRKRGKQSLSITFKESDKYGCVVPFFRCRQCGAGFKAVARRLKIDPFRLLLGYAWQQELEEGYGEVEALPEPSPPVWTEKSVAAWADRLQGEPLKRLTEWRGLSVETIRRYRLGLRGNRYALPVWAEDLMAGRRLVGVMTCTHDDKVHQLKNSTAALYPDVPDSEWLLTVEGAWDALLGRQFRLPTITGTAGAETWRDEWTWEVQDRELLICYDADDAGRRGAAKVKAAIPHAQVIDLAPRRRDGWDLSDHLRKYQNTSRLMAMIKGAR